MQFVLAYGRLLVVLIWRETGYNDPANNISIDDVRMVKMHDGQMDVSFLQNYLMVITRSISPCEITLQADFDRRIDVILD